MSTTDDRLVNELADHITATHPQWGLAKNDFHHRMQSPVEPCEQCGRRVFLMLPEGWPKPCWFTLGDVVGADTATPGCRTRRHECGDGDSWSVEAALFVQQSMASWGVTP